MPIQMQLQNTELRVTISRECDAVTIRSCVQQFAEMDSSQIHKLHITLRELKTVTSGLLGLMLWLKDGCTAVYNQLDLVNCDVTIWKMLGMTEIVDHYMRTGVLATEE